MSDNWVLKSRRLERALDDKEELRLVQKSFINGNMEKKLLHIDCDGLLTQYSIDKLGKITLLLLSASL